jgi:hypothetical protein
LFAATAGFLFLAHRALSPVDAAMLKAAVVALADGQR